MEGWTKCASQNEGQSSVIWVRVYCFVQPRTKSPIYFRQDTTRPSLYYMVDKDEEKSLHVRKGR